MVLFKHGFSEILRRLRLGPISFFSVLWLRRKSRKEELGKPFPVRIRLTLEELGPTFIKFGQMLSMRPDLISADIVSELQKLQDQVPPFDTTLVREIIAGQLQKPVDDIFTSFSHMPDAAASIAQVHKAYLADGTCVAVKVQRPGLRQQIAVDLEILFYLADLAEKHIPEVSLINPTAIVREFAKSLYNEIDFQREARNMESFRKYFSQDESIHIPAVIHEYTTERILTMEYIDGIKVSDIDMLTKKSYDKKQIALNGVNAFFKQVFEFGFFHADPHAGNIFILPQNVIAPVDFGIIGFINQHLRKQLGRALKAFIDRDGYQFAKVLRDLELVEESNISRDLCHDIEHLINYYYNMPFNQIRIGAAVFDLIDIIRKYHVRIPADLILLGKTVAVVETIGKNLDPGLNIADCASPYVQKAILEAANPIRQAKDFLQFLNDSGDFMKDLPDELRTILKKVRQDKLKVQLDHTGLDYFVKEMDKASNRLSFSIIIAAFLIGSSFVSQFTQGPTILGIPIFAFIGFASAGFLGLVLLVAIIRSGRL